MYESECSKRGGIEWPRNLWHYDCSYYLLHSGDSLSRRVGWRWVLANRSPKAQPARAGSLQHCKCHWWRESCSCRSAPSPFSLLSLLLFKLGLKSSLLSALADFRPFFLQQRLSDLFTRSPLSPLSPFLTQRSSLPPFLWYVYPAVE